MQNLMKEYESETKYFYIQFFCNKKQLFDVHEDTLQGTAGLSHHYIWKTSISAAVAIESNLQCGTYSRAALVQLAKSQEFSNVRAIQVFERKILFSVLNSGTIFERDLRSSDSVAKFATQKTWVF